MVGSGKFTGYLLRTGAPVIAVGPVPQMLEKLALEYPDVIRHLGAASAIPLPDGSVDAVVCAQAFHWFANAATFTDSPRAETAWAARADLNLRDASIGWIQKLKAIFDRYEGDTTR